MTVMQTSLRAYKELRSDPVKIGKQQAVVLGCVEKSISGVNDKMISQRTGLPINVVTPRRGELERAGLVVKRGVARCPFTRKVTNFYVGKDFL